MAEPAGQQNTTSLSWRVQVCRWLWRVLGFIWGTLIVGIVIGTIANLNTSTTETPLAKLYIVHLARAYPLPLWSSLGFLAVLTLLSWLGSRERQTALAPPLSEHDRIYVLRRLRLRYEQMLAQSLQGAVQVELGLASRPAAVQNAASLSFRLPNQPEQLLPPHTSISEAYELAQQELLILGEPGAGKSTLLLELAHYLIERAEQDPTQSLPVVLPLSSWATDRHPLHEWLSEQFALLYDVPRSLSHQWLQTKQLLPLLDGLDEMEASARAACVAAINAYHRERLQSLVVCSRTNEYEAAARHERLDLHTAVVVQPLEPGQVDVYLANLGRPLAALRAALRKNTVLRELATTPLILQVLMLTYHETPVRGLSHMEAQLREQIWADYIQRMASRKGDVKRYPLHVTTIWLGWLARQMRQSNQVIFYLEYLQPDWLPKRRRASYWWSVALVFGLFPGLVVGLGVGMNAGLVAGLVVGPLVGLLLGFFLGALTTEPAEILSWSWEKAQAALVRGLLLGLVSGLLLGLVGGLLRGLFFGLSIGLANVLYFGLLVALPSGVSIRPLTERLALSPNEGIRRSVKNGLLILFTGLIFVPVFGLPLGLMIGPGGGLLVGLASVLLVGLIFGLGAAVHHYILRFWLSCTHTFPWKAVPFLDDATTRILLRRVGGGYSFTHRLLLDYFADLDVHPSLPARAESSHHRPLPGL